MGGCAGVVASQMYVPGGTGDVQSSVLLVVVGPGFVGENRKQAHTYAHA